MNTVRCIRVVIRNTSARARETVCQASTSLLTPAAPSTSRQKSTQSAPADSATPPHPAIPRRPTWSVHALLAACPQPTLSDATLAKLHALSALVPPAAGSPAHARMKGELEEMVRLVEGVRMAAGASGGARQNEIENVTENEKGEGEGKVGIPDGRIWPEGTGMVLSPNSRAVEFPDAEVESGRALLRHAAWTKDGFYVVEADRRKK